MTSILALQKTLISLGNETADKLQMASDLRPQIRLGEEAITEHNLLTILYRHQDVIKIEMFGKREEAKNGADWQWEIFGSELTLRLRVQAKRVYPDGLIMQLGHKSKNARLSQMERLLDSYNTHSSQHLPLYCFYCADKFQTKWEKNSERPYGCLFADASEVRRIYQSKGVGTRKLFRHYMEITYPWHWFPYDLPFSLGPFPLGPFPSGPFPSGPFPSGPFPGFLYLPEILNSGPESRYRYLEEYYPWFTKTDNEIDMSRPISEGEKRLKLEKGFIGRISIDMRKMK